MLNVLNFGADPTGGRFRECGTTVSTKCDMTHISNCWIQWSKLYANAFCIENNRGAMSLDHVLFVPERITDQSQYQSGDHDHAG